MMSVLRRAHHRWADSPRWLPLSQSVKSDFKACFGRTLADGTPMVNRFDGGQFHVKHFFKSFTNAFCRTGCVSSFVSSIISQGVAEEHGSRSGAAAAEEVEREDHGLHSHDSPRNGIMKCYRSAGRLHRDEPIPQARRTLPRSERIIAGDVRCGVGVNLWYSSDRSRRRPRPSRSAISSTSRTA